MKPIVKRLLSYGALLLLPASWLGSEFLYAARIRPSDIHTMADHVRRFGEPRYVYEAKRDGGTFYEFTGFSLAAPPLLAVPSSPPAYIYDSYGHFVDWCSDPGDQPEHYKKWPRASNAPLDVQTIRHFFPPEKSSAQ